MAGKTEYKNQWLSENRERIGLIVDKGKKEIIKQQAEKNNMSINAYINDLIERDLKNATDSNNN